MAVVVCPFPAGTLLEREAAVAYYRDSHRVPLSRRATSVVDAFHAIFGHRPLWMKAALVARNRIASWCGLDAPPASQILRPRFKQAYAVGETIGSWPLYALTESELVAGRDNKHLDFRLSIMKSGTAESVVVSTVCTVHNRFGKLYLFFILPFHRIGLRWLLERAAADGRL